MKLKFAISLLFVPSIVCTMEQDSELAFLSTYQKKRTIAQALDSGLPKKKKRFPSQAQKAFEAAIDQKDINAAYRILKDNNYYPKHISLGQAIRADDLPDFMYWLGTPRNRQADHDPYAHALIAATALGNEFFMKILIEAGAPINAENENGWTPLNFAVWHNRSQAVRLLLYHGARENVPNLHGRTPLYYLAHLFSRERNIPYQATTHLVTTFLAHAQWNERNIHIPTSKAWLKTVLLSLRRVCPQLPVHLRHKVLAHMPEHVYSEKLFRLIFPFIENNRLALEQLVEMCPVTWFRALSHAKRMRCTAASGAHERYIGTVVPLIAAYRVRRTKELLAPLSGDHKLFIERCMQELQQEKQHLLLNAVINDLT